ncbi:MAG: hypothetical protein IJ723_03185 [Ruminococcus sp.]|nr:hypothetical protein [Ruminococcus sp.]
MRIETELMVRITERSTGRVINSKGYLNEYHEPTENVTAADGSEVYDVEFAPYLHSAHDLPKYFDNEDFSESTREDAPWEWTFQ